MKKYIILFACLVCGACGFHLKHHAYSLNKQFPMIILPPSGTHTFHQALHRALTSASIRVREESSSQKAAPILRVASQKFTQQPLVYGPNAELRRERLTMAVTFSLTVPEQDPRTFELSTARDRQLDGTQFLGDNAEKMLLEQEMQTDIIAQLLRFLAAEPI